MVRSEPRRRRAAFQILFGALVSVVGSRGQGAMFGQNRQVTFLQTPGMWQNQQMYPQSPPWNQYSMVKKRSPEPQRSDAFFDGGQPNPYQYSGGPYQTQNAQYYQPQRFSQLPNYDGRASFSYDQERSEARNPQTGRLISNSALTTFSETLGAINTVGHYLVDKVNEKENKKDEAQIPHALLTISKNVLGRNVTDTLAPFVSLFAVPKAQSQSDAPTNKILPLDPQLSKVTTFQAEGLPQESDTKTCTTPEGKPGVCDDLSNCPQLLLNLGNLRESLCFKSLFVPGVCCPSDGLNSIALEEKPTVFTTSKPTYLVPVTTRKPTTTKRPSAVLVLTTKRPTTVRSTTARPTTSRPTTARPKTTTLATTRPTTVKPPVSSTFLTVAPPVVGNFSNIVDIAECGQREDEGGRIVGGTEAKSGSWPWMAAIFLHGDKRREFWCGGSLVGARHVLTAAHCTRDSKQRPFPARQFSVRLGDVDLASTTEPSRPVTARVVEVRAHEQFSRVGFYNDIALLVLAEPVQKNKYVIPICLPAEHLARHQFDGASATVVGWGTTRYGGTESSQQLQATLPVWRNEDCDRAYFQPIRENFICAGYTEGGTDACQGDSGGPLMLSVGGRWTQIGVVSFGNKCGEPGYPGVYTRLTHYRGWLQANIA